MEPIQRKVFSPQDRLEVQDAVIEAVTKDPERFLALYVKDARSFEGRFISADLFKDCFEQYSASRESRNRYNAPVHNAAAVLASEQYRRVIADASDKRRDTVVFLTGIPGAGKTSSVLDSGELPETCQAVFEGQLSRPEPSIIKIQQALDAGFKVRIDVVHVKPETALTNTLRRFDGYGRGASINVMAEIQGNLPAGLAEVHRRFGDRVGLHILDHRDLSQPKIYEKWDNLDILKSEGNHEQIRQRLDVDLERRRAEISDAAWRQAKGLAPEGTVHSRPVGERHE
jgi:hypothetical protein